VRIPHPQRAADDPATAGVFREMAAGWRELVRYRGLLVLTLVLAVAVFIYIPVGALFPLMTLGHFGGGAFQASMVELAFGGGMLVGSLLIGVLGRKIRGGRMTAYGILLLGVTLVAGGFLPKSGFVAFVIICVAMGLSAPAFSTPLQAMFQSMIDPAKLGRVLSLTTTIMVLASPLGLLVAGPLAERFGVAFWFALSGALLLVVGGFCLVSRDVRGLDAPAPGQARGHARSSLDVL
jgi:DHA3 family macrolide efflux protein-like MFS transporter